MPKRNSEVSKFSGKEKKGIDFPATYRNIFENASYSNVQSFVDLLDLLALWQKSDSRTAIKYIHESRVFIQKGLRECIKRGDATRAELYNKLLYRSYVLGARESFEDYLIAIEYNRDPKKKFYTPRKHYLKPMVEAYQELADGDLKFLSISLPKRAGKSQLGINFTCWVSGKRPDLATLMEGTGGDLVTSFYRGCLEYFQSDEYSYHDIFPLAPLIDTNARLLSVNLEKVKRFPTIMCRSIDQSQVGLSEATNLLYLDDLVAGRSEAINRDLLDKKWEVVSADVIGRSLSAPIVICGTRYSIYDPIGRMQEYARKMDWKWKAIELPALDPKTDESTCEYYNPMLEKKIFTTEYFKEQRELISAEQWESEFQQQPFEAKGVLFPKDALQYFYELPTDKDPDAVIAVCDTAEKGSDYTALVVAYLYDEDVYVADVVFDSADATHTKPQCARMLFEHNVSEATFESNGAGEYYARDVNTMLKNMGGRTSIRTRRTQSNKETRIEFASDNVVRHFWFKHESTYKANDQYAEFMRNIWTYTRMGKVKHDDAPDALSMLENLLKRRLRDVQIINRPF